MRLAAIFVLALLAAVCSAYTERLWGGIIPFPYKSSSCMSKFAEPYNFMNELMSKVNSNIDYVPIFGYFLRYGFAYWALIEFPFRLIHFYIYMPLMSPLCIYDDYFADKS